MKSRRSHSAFTLLELLVVIVVLFVLTALLLPSRPLSGKAHITVCMSNQKQINLGMTMFCADNTGKYPWQLSATNGGSAEFASGNELFPHFRTLAQYFGNQTEVAVCPTDQTRSLAANFAQLVDTNISYFLNREVTPDRRAMASGDRNLKTGDQPVPSGALVVTTNTDLKWTGAMHVRKGILGFGDGHAQFIRTDLDFIVQSQPVATNLFWIP